MGVSRRKLKNEMKVICLLIVHPWGYFPLEIILAYRDCKWFPVMLGLELIVSLHYLNWILKVHFMYHKYMAFVFL